MRQLPVTKNQLASLAGIERLLIVRLGSMGDIIHTLPAVIALRQAFPNALIGWVIEERWAELLCTLPTPRSGARSPQRPLVDRIHTVDTAKWRKSFLSLQTLQEIASALSDLRAPRYQIAVDFQGAVRSALIARWSGATTIYGAAQPRENVASMFYTRTVMARGDHIIEQNMSLAWAVTGSALEIPALEFPHDEVAKQDCDRRRQEQRLYKFVIMNPGAGWGAKRWPEQRYGEVARELAKDGIKILVNYGPGEEALARAVEEASGGVAKAIACSLTQLIALTRRAALFIGGDTGPMHLAAALGVPVVAIFGPTNPVRNGPFGTKSIVLRSSSSITSHVRRHEPEEGLLEINSVAVVAAARQLLGDCRG
jgi:heptosyltransferase I